MKISHFSAKEIFNMDIGMYIPEIWVVLYLHLECPCMLQFSALDTQLMVLF